MRSGVVRSLADEDHVMPKRLWRYCRGKNKRSKKQKTKPLYLFKIYVGLEKIPKGLISPLKTFHSLLAYHLVNGDN